jgi:hypothetical protein
MNDFGDVVGYAVNLNNESDERAVLSKEGEPPTVLDTTSQPSWAVSVTNGWLPLGSALASSERHAARPCKVAGMLPATNPQHAAVFQDGGVRDLHADIGAHHAWIGGFYYSRAWDINDAGLLVGDGGNRHDGMGEPFLCDTGFRAASSATSR